MLQSCSIKTFGRPGIKIHEKKGRKKENQARKFLKTKKQRQAIFVPDLVKSWILLAEFRAE